MIFSAAPKILNQPLHSRWSAWLLRLFCFMNVACLIAINAWREAGTFTWQFSYPGYEEISTVTQAEPVYSVPGDDVCGWLLVGLGEIMKDIPVEGAKSQWSGSCQTAGMGSEQKIVQGITSTVLGWEQKTTRLGTFRARGSNR